jgi:opacity protein-like surface antigen
MMTRSSTQVSFGIALLASLLSLAAVDRAFGEDSIDLHELNQLQVSGSDSFAPFPMADAEADNSMFTECSLSDDVAQRRFYISGILGASWMRLASGGVNTAEGSFANTGTDNEPLFTAGGALGVSFARSNGALRWEVEGRGRNNFSGTTGGFQPPSPTFAYGIQVTDNWLLTTNLWRDFWLTDRMGVYGGGGIGGGGYQLAVNDGVVDGAGSVTSLAWQAGGGVIYQVSQRVTLDLGYRYFGLGTGNTQLNTLAGGTPAGSYSSSLSANELLFSIRVYEPFAMLRR